MVTNITFLYFHRHRSSMGFIVYGYNVIGHRELERYIWLTKIAFVTYNVGNAFNRNVIAIGTSMCVCK